MRAELNEVSPNAYLRPRKIVWKRSRLLSVGPQAFALSEMYEYQASRAGGVDAVAQARQGVAAVRRAVATASDEQQRDAQNARQALNPRLSKAERQALPPGLQWTVGAQPPLRRLPLGERGESR